MVHNRMVLNIITARIVNKMGLKILGLGALCSLTQAVAAQDALLAHDSPPAITQLITNHSILNPVSANLANIQQLESNVEEGDTAENRTGQSLNNIWRRVNKIPNIHQADQVFTQQEITAGPGVMIVKPGVYHVAENITFSNEVAIIIASDNVVLDLNERSIDGEGVGQVAVQLRAGYRNVSIINGVIKRCACAGIYAGGSEEADVQNPLENLIIKDVQVVGLGVCDSAVNERDDLESALDALSDESGFDNVIECCLSDQFNRLVKAVGIYIDCADKVTIDNCTVFDVQGDGVFLRSVQNALIKNSGAQRNGADGFVFESSNTCCIEACKSEQNGFNGFHEIACFGDNTYSSCIAKQNGVHGFRVIGGGNIVQDCISNQNTLDGFHVITPQSTTLDGSLDITFGGDGKVVTDLGGLDIVNAIAIQKDGKIVVGGSTESGGAVDFALARYNTDGSLDANFGSSGIVITNLGGNDQIQGIAIQQDGRIVAAGFSNAAGSFNFVVARYTPDGILDADFNSTGIVTTDFGGTDLAQAVTLQKDGKIIVVGYSNASGSNDFALARYNTDGTLDTTFNGTGMVTTDLGVGSNDQAHAVTLQEDGKIVVAGYSNANGSFDFAVARYNTDGSLDTSFNGTGFVITDFGGGSDDAALGVTLQKDGKIVAVGGSDVDGSYDFALARYNTDGSLDTSFNGSGLVTADFGGGSDDYAFAVVTQNDGKIISAGYSDVAGGYRFALARHNTDGSLDTSFNGTGTLTTNFNGSDDEAFALAIQADGKVVAAGYTDLGEGSYDFALARYSIFKRCSMMQDCTAQANGRDGFNLENASEVAILNSQASCNTRNGFVASSPTANNLYSNLSYDNGANYVSATNLTVLPDEISSYWANVDPDKSVFDCNLCSLVEAIDSKIDLLHSKVDVLDSEVEVIDSKVDVVDSKVDALQDALGIIEILVGVIDAKTEEIDSTIDALTACINHTCSVIDVIEDKIDAVDSEVEVIDSKVDALDNGVEIVGSKIDILIERDCCTCEQFIYQADIPYVISSPGIYCLAESVQNTGLNDFLITVSSSDVVLDLGEHLMNGGTQGGLAQGASDGVVVYPGMQNVTIKKGTLSNFARYAINVGVIAGSDVQAPVESLTIEDIQVIDVSEFLPSTTDQLDLVGSTLDSLSANAGFDKVLECCLGDQFSRVKTAAGIFVHCANKVTIARCCVFHAQGDGFFLRYVQDGIVEDCQAGRSGGNGFVLDNCDVSCINACKAEQNCFNGFYEVACSGDNSYRDCTAKQNGVHGFRIIGGGKTIDNCIANQNTLDGFHVVSPQNTTVDGSLDITFGGDGVVKTDFNTSDDRAFATALQKDGKIVAAGFSGTGGSFDFAVARYNTDGSLDTSFNGSGKVTTNFGGTDEAANGVAIQEDGKIIAAGYTDAGGNYNVALARYNIDGSLDTSFNGTGQVATNLGSFDKAFAITLQEDGKIVIAGFKFPDLAVARYNTDGSLDTTFNGTGIAVFTSGSITNTQANAIAIQKDGKIVVAGTGFVSGTGSFLVVRFNSDGSLDTNFNGTGSVATSFGGMQEANAIAIQKDGKLVVAGQTDAGGGLDFALARYNNDGSLDTSFNGTGKVITDLGTNADIAYAIVLQKDGKIMAVGRTIGDFAIVRYTNDGSLDTSFNGTGIVTTDFLSVDEARAALLQKDGKLVAVGLGSGTGFDFVLARYNIFKRCSTMRNLIAQANGRDGFNLECAYDVALLSSEASCNARNGFVASSTTANNLYTNLAYSNLANYLSATDLTVSPVSISSYWGNVEPDKSTSDLFVDKFSVMESLLYAIHACSCP